MKTSHSRVPSLSVAELVREWPRWSQFVVSVFFAAVIAHFATDLAIAATGVWRDRLMAPVDVFGETTILMVVSAIGAGLRKIWRTTTVVLLILLVYFVQHYVRAGIPILGQWAAIVSPIGQLLLNGWLCQRFLKASAWHKG